MTQSRNQLHVVFINCLVQSFSDVIAFHSLKRHSHSLLAVWLSAYCKHVIKTTVRDSGLLHVQASLGDFQIDWTAAYFCALSRFIMPVLPSTIRPSVEIHQQWVILQDRLSVQVSPRVTVCRLVDYCIIVMKLFYAILSQKCTLGHVMHNRLDCIRQ